MKRANLKKAVDIFLFVLMAAGFILISFDAMSGGGMYWRGIQKIKVITFAIAGVLCARFMYRVTWNKNIFVKSISLILMSFISTIIIFFYNNWLHSLNYILLHDL